MISTVAGRVIDIKNSLSRLKFKNREVRLTISFLIINSEICFNYIKCTKSTFLHTDDTIKIRSKLLFKIQNQTFRIKLI